MSDSNKPLLPLLVPMRVRAMKLSKRVRESTHFKYVSNNYDNLIKSNGSPLAQPSASSQPIICGVRLHWQLPRAMRHGTPGALLTTRAADSNNQNLIQITQYLSQPQDANSSEQLLNWFKNDLMLPLTEGFTITLVNTEPDFVWQISSWADARHYLIHKLALNGNQPMMLEIRDARISFPKVPNRWLIIRLMQTPTANPIPSSVPQGLNMQAWLIESDTQDTHASCQFLLPNTDQTQGHLPFKLVTIGKVYDLDPQPNATQPGWNESRKEPMFLTAVGPGDPTFSVFAPSAENVFTFLDKNLPPDEQDLTYQVYGWYSNTDDDIFRGDSVESICQQLKWQLSQSGSDSTLPSQEPASNYQTILHGMVHSVKWNNANEEEDPSEIPNINNTYQYAVGSTSADALAAFLGAQGSPNMDPSILAKLIALQNGYLNHFNAAAGSEMAALRRRQDRYGSVPGGLFWEIRSTADETGQVVEQEAHADLLAQLNSHQANVDGMQRSLASSQWKLHSHLWRVTQLQTNLNLLKSIGGESERKKSIDASIAYYNEKAKYLKDTISDSLSHLSNEQQNFLQPISLQINNSLGASQRLVAKPAPRFWHPNDPVVLIEGMGNPDTETTTTCRLLEQCLRFQNTADSERFKANIPLLNPTIKSDIPSAIAALYEENYHLLQPQNNNLIGQNPDERACMPWKQPWVPIFLDWALTWYPTSSCNKSDVDPDVAYEFDPTAWAFDGDDYQTTSQIKAIDNKLEVNYIGRTILSAHANDNLIAQIDSLLQQQVSGSDGRHLSSELKDFLSKNRILTQRLSGFLDKLVMRSPNQSLPPIGTVANLIQDQYHTIPDLSNASNHQGTGPILPMFFPQMGGFFQITKLEIIDLFGQCISVLDYNSSEISHPPIRSQDLIPKTAPNINNQGKDIDLSNILLQLPFGLIQPAQLMMRWIDVNDNTKEVGLAADANPVCGWILPNHLDHSLAFYDSEGVFLGEVGGSIPTWTESPQRNNGPVETQQESGNIISQMIDYLKNPKYPDLLDEWLTAIDESLWVIDPLGGDGDPDLSVLIGRPLVILNLKLALRLDGEPYTNQRTQDGAPDSRSVDNGIQKMSFSVRLGSDSLPHDGLVGFFFTDKFISSEECNILHVVRGSSGISGDNHTAPGVTPQDSQSNYVTTDTTLMVFPSAEENNTYVTVLMDPRGSLHGSTGILPVKEITIPARFIDEPLRRMQLWFRVRSLLSPTSVVCTPRLTEQNGTWEWWEKDATGNWLSQPLTFSTPNATLSVPPLSVRDGWLKLTPKKLE
jgi:hypothetical protein